jgi:F-type H+-transporting ATPase subunit b
MSSAFNWMLCSHRFGWFVVATALSAAAFGQAEGEPAAVPATVASAAEPAAAAAADPAAAPSHANPASAAAQPEASEHEAHGTGHHGTAPHEELAPPTVEDINWFYGILGESGEGEPNLFFRSKGMPVPFVATLFNWAIFLALIVTVAKKQIPSALARRKSGIVQGMQDAQKVREESAERLREYENKLAQIDRDVERVKDDMRRAGEQERDRILAEAVERRARMERDARRLLETEIEAAKESLRHEIVSAALAAAKTSITRQVEAADQQRLFDEAIVSLNKLPEKTLGGRA